MSVFDIPDSRSLIIGRATELEITLRETLHTTAIERIEQLGLEDSAMRLDLYPPGVSALVWHTHWSLSSGLRVCDALGLNVREIVQGNLII